MTTLRTIMSSDILDVAPRMTVRQAIDEMRNRHVPSAPVQSDGRVIGTVASDDLMLIVHRVGPEAKTPGGGGASQSVEREPPGRRPVPNETGAAGGAGAQRARTSFREDREAPLSVSLPRWRSRESASR